MNGACERSGYSSKDIQAQGKGKEAYMAKKTMFVTVLMIAVAFLVYIPVTCLAQSADNTGINKRDQAKNELTADQQGETKQDRDITQKIRRAVIKDKSLSIQAHNVKIITVDGMVTLKGPVRSEEEKMSVEEKAVQVVGSDKVKNEIGIAPKNSY